jgi:hypothetical protein
VVPAISVDVVFIIVVVVTVLILPSRWIPLLEMPLLLRGTEEQASGMVRPRDLKTLLMVFWAIDLGRTGNIFNCPSILVSRAGQLLLTRWNPKVFLSFVSYLQSWQ